MAAPIPRHIHSSKPHFQWSRDLEPVLRVASGSEVTLDLRDGGNNQIRPDNIATAMSSFDASQADPAIGPIYVEGCEPGDVLKVEILELTPGDYGWTGIFPGLGLLADEFAEAAVPDAAQRVKLWDLTAAGCITAGSSSSSSSSGGRRAVFKPGVSVPIRPFLGVLGVAPAGAEALSTLAPHPRIGGNLDCRHLVAGATVYFSAQVAGALLSAGDGHAAQGDGEVCGTAIETPMRARLRLTVEKGDDGGGGGKKKKLGSLLLTSPHVLAPPDPIDAEELASGGRYVALGVGPDPREAAREAVRGLLGWLEADKGLSRPEAYMLASVAASLALAEVVDMPNYCVSCSIPLRTFEKW
ncbi:hypothetical protein RB594_007980 [Gaeumannomyces avenae]